MCDDSWFILSVCGDSWFILGVCGDSWFILSVCGDGWFILGAMTALHHRCVAPPRPESNQSDSDQVRL